VLSILKRLAPVDDETVNMFVVDVPLTSSVDDGVVLPIPILPLARIDIHVFVVVETPPVMKLILPVVEALLMIRFPPVRAIRETSFLPPTL